MREKELLHYKIYLPRDIYPREYDISILFKVLKERFSSYKGGDKPITTTRPEKSSTRTRFSLLGKTVDSIPKRVYELSLPMPTGISDMPVGGAIYKKFAQLYVPKRELPQKKKASPRIRDIDESAIVETRINFHDGEAWIGEYTLFSFSDEGQEFEDEALARGKNILETIRKNRGRVEIL